MRTSVDTLNIRKMRSSSPQTGAFETTLSENEPAHSYEEDLRVKPCKLRSFSFSSATSDSGGQMDLLATSEDDVGTANNILSTGMFHAKLLAV